MKASKVRNKARNERKAAEREARRWHREKQRNTLIPQRVNFDDLNELLDRAIAAQNERWPGARP